MTRLEVPRGKLRAAVASVLPHAGRATDDTPHLGRLRFHVTGDAVHVYATDIAVQALAAIWDPAFLDESADGFDLAAGEARKVLQVFRPPSNATAREMWEQQAVRLDVTSRQVTMTETGDLVAGQSLTLPLVETVGDDPYPDVPRLLMNTLRPQVPITVTTLDALVVDMPSLARFAAAATAYDRSFPLVRLVQVGPASKVLVEIGGEFIGQIADYRLSQPVQVTEQEHRRWETALGPMMRPERVIVPDALVEQFKAGVSSALAGSEVSSVRVLRDGDAFEIEVDR